MIAGLDIGTSNCKLSVYEGCNLLVQTSATYPARRSGGRHTLDANLVWEAVQSLFRQAVALEAKAAHIQALAVSALGEAAVPLSASGEVVGEALLFWDSSGKEEMYSIVDKVGQEKIQAITGVVPDPMYTLPKIAWRKKHDPDYGRMKYLLLFEDFIIQRLTGERMISYSLACRTLALDLAARDWSQTMFDAAGVDPAIMSKPVASGTPAGTVLPSVRQALGLKGEVLVTTGGHDQMCVAVGAGAIQPGIASNGSGTVEVMAVTMPEMTDYSALLRDTYTVSIHADPARRFTYSCNSTGSLLLDWYTRTFGDPESKTRFVDFENAAPKQPTRLLALPYITGTGTPFMDFSARGAVSGLSYDTTRYDIYRAMMEGLTFDMAHNIDNITAAGVAVSELRCTGGGSQSKMWLQIKADITGLPVHTMQNHQAGSLGCMILAAVAAGIYPDLYQAVGDMVKTRECYYPTPANEKFYGEQKARFIELFQATRHLHSYQ